MARILLLGIVSSIPWVLIGSALKPLAGGGRLWWSGLRTMLPAHAASQDIETPALAPWGIGATGSRA